MPTVTPATSRFCVRSVHRLLVVGAVVLTLGLNGQRVDGTEGVFVPPSDMSIQPNVGPPGTAVSVTGHCFGAILGPVPVTVTFTDSAGHVGPTWSATITVPDGAWSVSLMIPISASLGRGHFTGDACEAGVPTRGFLVTPGPPTTADQDPHAGKPTAPAASPVEGHARFTG